VRFELVGGARQLEGMRTTADRVTPFDRFEAHRHARYGSFLDPVDLAERKPALPSDALVGVPMVRVTRRGDGVVVLGRRTGRGECEMSLLVNGVPRRLMQPGDFDLLVGPVEHVRAVEVYARASDVPAEYIYESDMLQCGLVAVWTSITARQSALPAPARASP